MLEYSGAFLICMKKLVLIVSCCCKVQTYKVQAFASYSAVANCIHSDTQSNLASQVKKSQTDNRFPTISMCQTVNFFFTYIKTIPSKFPIRGMAHGPGGSRQMNLLLMKQTSSPTVRATSTVCTFKRLSVDIFPSNHFSSEFCII